MTTDNRASEPTPEQVEAAAKALASREPMRSATAWENLHEFERKHYRDDSRAALVAAQGAAPQAEAMPETGNEMRDADGDLISSGKHLRVLHQGGYVCDTCANVLGLNVRWDHAVKRNDHTPVPSSGVDEVALAEVERAAAVRARGEALIEIVQAHRNLHMTYGSTAVCRGGIGGQVMTAHCAEICYNADAHETEMEVWRKLEIEAVEYSRTRVASDREEESK